MEEGKPTVNKIEKASQKGSGYSLEKRPGPDLSPAEKAEQVWGLFREYRSALYQQRVKERKGEKVEEPEKGIAQRLEGEIARLWKEPAVKSIATAKIREAVRERQPHQPSIERYQVLRKQSEELERNYYDLLRNEFLMRQITPTLRRMDMASNRFEFEQSKKEISSLEQPQGPIKRDRSELAALFASERLKDYHRQFRDGGFIMTPSRQELLDEVLTKTASGTWMQLIGETGTGKTTFAKQASWILNQEPAQYASGEKSGDVRSLLGTRAMRGDQVYYDFGPLVVALTGCQNSLEMEEAVKSGKEPSGKLLILDELNKFDQDALFGALKIAATLRPGEIFNFKELPGVKLRMAKRGVAIVSTMNPATERYERKAIDPALDRLFYDGKKRVDYPPMTDTGPELYEMFLGILMDENGRIRVAKDELAPSFIKQKDQAAGTETLVINPDVKSHGTLYRFALAAAEIHKSFTQKENVTAQTATDNYLEKAVLEMEILVKWMNGYSAEIENGGSLEAYLEKKLHNFYSNIDSAGDKKIFKDVFTVFGFDIENPRSISKPDYVPLTPLEIGYLTPKTPRETIKIGEELVPRTKVYVIPETGEEIEYLPVPVEIEKDKLLSPDDIYVYGGKRYRYLGKDSTTQEELVVPLGE